MKFVDLHSLNKSDIINLPEFGQVKLLRVLQYGDGEYQLHIKHGKEFHWLDGFTVINLVQLVRRASRKNIQAMGAR